MITETTAKSNQNTKINVGLSHAFIDKVNTTGDKRAFAQFPMTEIDLRQFVAHVLGGKAWIPSTFTGGHRKDDNWQRAGLIGLDYDDNVSVADLLAVPFVAQYALLVHPSASSSTSKYKTRAVFCLDQDITGDIDAYKWAAKAICEHIGLPYDPASFKPAQLFYGSTNRIEAPHINYEAVLPLALVEELKRPLIEAECKRADEAARRRVEANYRPIDASSTRAQHYANAAYIRALDDLARTGEGGRNDMLFKIAAGMFGRALGNWPGFDMASIEADLTAVARGIGLGNHEIQVTINSARKSAKPEALPPLPDRPAPIRSKKPLADQVQAVELPGFTATDRVNLRYVSDIPLETFDGYNVICIKSPTNTGKTELGKGIIARYADLLGREPRVMAITHRRALVHNLADRLGLMAYDSFTDENRDLVRLAPQVATTLDSLRLFAGLEYDLILIDEVNQFLPHVTGDTMKAGENGRAYEVLKQQIDRARQVFAFDATATDTALDWLAAVRPGGKLMALENEYRQDKGDLTLFKDIGAAWAQIHRWIDDNAGPVVVACATKNESELIYAALENAYHKPGHKGYLINADNSESYEAQEFISNINDRLADLSYFVYSPSLGTGVDITAPVYAAVGLFHNQPLTPPDFLQLLGRCRNASNRAAWVQPYNGSASTDWHELYKPPVLAAGITAAVVGLADPGVNDTTKALNRLEAVYEAERNHYRQDHISAFVALAQGDGYRLRFDDNLSKAFLTARKNTRDELKEQKKNATLAAAPVSDDQLDQYRRAGELQPVHRAGNLRWKIENLIGQDITPKLYDDLHRKNNRLKVHRLADLLDDYEALADLDRQQAGNGTLLSKRRHSLARVHLFNRIVAHVFNCRWDELPTVLQDMPADEVEARMSEVIERFGIHLEALLGWRPGHNSNQANYLLKWIFSQYGMKVKSRQVMQDGRRFMVYSLDLDTWAVWLAYAKAQLDQRKKYRDEAITTNWLNTKNPIRSNAISEPHNRRDYDKNKPPERARLELLTA